MILVTGAAGKTGRAVIEALAGRGEPVRAFVRREEQAGAVQAAGAAEVVAGDMIDPATFRRAAEGVRAIYHIAPNMNPDEVAMGQNALDAGQAAGIERFVYHSVLHPQVEAMPHHWNKMRVEERVFASGLDFTILQPTAYMQNVLAQRFGMVERAVYLVPYPAETRISLVDLRDVAEVAARVLREDGHRGATYELCAAAPNQTEIVAALNEVMSREIFLSTITAAKWKSGAAPGGRLSAYAIDALAAMFEYYAAHGLTGSPNVLRWLLGRAPTDFETFARREFGRR